MTSMKQQATDYKGAETKNISELEVVDISEELHNDGKGIDSNGKEFTYMYMIVNGEHYYVPKTVLKDLQAILKQNPNVSKIKVAKQGEGMKTKYTVVPIM